MSANYRNPNWLLPNELNQSINPSLSESRKSLYSMNFDGSDYINLGNNFNFGDGDNDFPFSLSIWFYRPSTGSARILIRDSEWELRITSGNSLYLQLNDNNSRYRGKSGTFTGTGWHHIAATYTGVGGTNAQDGIKIYVDGVRIDDTDINSGGNYKSMHNNGGDTNLARLPNGTGYTAGKFDELAIWNKALSATEVAALATANAPANLMALSAKPFAYYPLGEFAGNSGELGGTPSGQTNSWKFPNQAIKDYVFNFDSNPSLITIPDSNALRFVGTDFSISFWLKPTTSGNQIIMDKYGGGGWGVFLQNGNLRFLSYGPSYWQTMTTVSQNVWTHILIIGDNTGQNLICYKNGTEVYNATYALSVNSTTVDLIIGTENSSATFDYVGYLSNIVMWNSNQSSEKDNIYNNGSPATSYTNTPTAWWKLNAATSSYNPATSTWTITDSAGSNNGTSTTLSSSSLIPSDLQFESPYSNFSLDFDGSTSYINCGNGSSLNVSGDLSISAWVYIDAHKSYNGIISKIDATNRNYEILVRSTANISFYSNDGAGGSIIQTNSTTTIADNTWTHIAVVVNSGVSNGTKFYFNGVEDATKGTHTIVGQTNDLHIGQRATGGFNFNGKIDEVSIFNSALTAAQINQVYNNGRPGDLTSLSPISWWRLGEDAFFVNNNITIPNQISGGPTGTGSGTQTAMLSADAPQSYGGGYGVGLVVTDKIGDAPESTANSLSYNMIPDNRHPYTPSYAPAKVDNAFSMSFNGSDEYINIGAMQALNNVNKFSISGWYKFDNTSRLEAIVSNGGAVNNYNFLLQHWPGSNVSFFIANSLTDGGNNYVKTSDNFITSTNDFYHIVVVYDGSLSTNILKAKIYVNGNDVTVNGGGTIPISTTNTTGTFNIGQWENEGRFFDGNIDEVAIFDYALTAKQIKEDIYNASTTGKTANLSNNSNLKAPVAWYRMGD